MTTDYNMIAGMKEEQLRFWYPIEEKDSKSEVKRRTAYFKENDKYVEITMKDNQYKILEAIWNGQIYLHIRHPRTKAVKYTQAPDLLKGQLEGPWLQEVVSEFVSEYKDKNDTYGTRFNFASQLSTQSGKWKEETPSALTTEESVSEIRLEDSDGYDIDVEMAGYDTEVGALIAEMVIKNRLELIAPTSQGSAIVTAGMEAMVAQMKDITGKEIGEFNISTDDENEMLNAVEIAECVAEFRAEENRKHEIEQETIMHEEVEAAAAYFDMIANKNPDIRETREWIKASNKRMQDDMDQKSVKRRVDRTIAAGKRRAIYSVATGMLASIHANSNEMQLRWKEKKKD